MEEEKKAPLVKPQIVLQKEIDAIRLNIKELEDAVKNGEGRIRALKAELKLNKPYSAAIQKHQGKVEEVDTDLLKIRVEINQLAGRLQAAREAVARAERVESEAIPRRNEIELAEKAYRESNVRAQELRDLLADVRSEIIINAAAAPAPYPKTNRKKVMAWGFLVPALCLFGLMLGFEMSSKSWRAESVASRLDLPILARYSPGGPNATECRGLSLRLRQYVPDTGGVILFSSLNERNGVEGLMADLVGYFALRDEKVLLLDARIANAEDGEIQQALGRAPARRPVEVVPRPDSSAAAVGPRRGLVQYLVFEGQDPWEFAVPTRTPAVDYLPAGGPYPVTDALASEPMRDLLEACRQKYSLILVLGPSVSKSIDTEILSAYVNGLVLVVNEPLSAFTPETRSFFQSLKEANVSLLGAVQCV